MLEEASPRRFKDHEVDTSAQDIRLMSPVKLVNQAWHQFYRDAVGYSDWEKNTICAAIMGEHQHQESGLQR